MISNKIVKASYLGNGVTRQWGIPFSYTDTSQICVALLENDVQTILDSNDYTVNTGSGVVVYPKTNDDPPIAAGVVLVVFRDTDITQLSDLTNQGGAWPETIETSLDKLTQIAQEQGEALERSVKVYISSDENPEDLMTNLYEKAAEATASASAAAISETNAYNSEIAASASAAAAYNSEVAAGNSATAAGNSATAAGISETNAGNSATAAHNSEVAAAASELAAGNSATAAHNSELAAGASETNAGNSATASYNSEVAAASSANSAAASASEAAGYAQSVDFRALLRQPSTAYALGTVVYLPSLGAAMYLECTTAGTTDSGDLVISTPTPNDTVTDGTVTWTIKKIGSGGGVPIGIIEPFAGNGQIPEGYLLCDGSAVSRTMFPDLFDVIGTTYGSGDGSTTFNLPSEQFAKAWVGSYESGDYAPITYTGDNQTASTGTVLATKNTNAKTASLWTGNSGYVHGYFNTTDEDVNLFADLSEATTTITPQYSSNIRYIIKAFDGQTPDSALIDITQYAQELAHKANIDGSNMVHHKDVITTSGTYTAPASGLYKITAKGGGGGGGGSYYTAGTGYGGGGGGEGGTTIAYEHLTVNNTVTVTIGAGGSGGAANADGNDGGDTTVAINGHSYVAGGGKKGNKVGNPGMGGTGTINGCAGCTGPSVYSYYVTGGSGGGAGGGYSTTYMYPQAGTLGGGGAGGGTNSNMFAGADGGDGYVWFEYFATN